VSIPFILVPQLLFSGVIVNFQKLHPAITSQKYVPIVGDLMTSRWAYEALVVEQFRDNDFQKHFFSYEKQMSESSFRASFLIPAIQQSYQSWLKDANDWDQRIFKNELLKLSEVFNFPSDLDFTDKTLRDSSERIQIWLEHVREASRKEFKQQSNVRDQVYDEIIDKLGGHKQIIEYKNTFHNEAVEQIVLNRREINKLKKGTDEIIQLKDPIFQTPVNTNGRAQLFASQKRVGNYLIDTFWFNLVVIWITTLIFYFSLYFDVLRRFILIIEILWMKILPEGHILITRKRQK
jgi:hypothetical protein